MWWADLGIRQKALLVFTVAASVPLILLNVVWLRTSQVQLKTAAANQQSLLVSTSASRIADFIDSELKSAVGHSQIQALIDMNIADAKLNLLQYSDLDTYAGRIALVDTKGNEKIVIKNHAVSAELKNIAEKDSFNVVRYRGNEASIGKIFYDNGQPRITISVPLLSYSKLGSQNLTDAQALSLRTGADTKGALIVDIDLSELWGSILDTELGSDGYAYIVDGDGMLIAHRNATFMRSHPNVAATDEVRSAIKTLAATVDEKAAAKYKPTPQVTQSESGVAVLSSHNPVISTGWTIIGQEPVSSVYAAANGAKQLALAILIGSVLLAGVLVYIATQSIVRPIRQLTLEAVSLGEGNFTQKLLFKGRDELSTLAQTFNKMGANLQSLLNRYREQNVALVAEQTKLQAVLNTIADGVVALTSTFEIALVNKTILSLSMHEKPEDLLGKPWLDAFSLVYDGKAFDYSLLEGEKMYFDDVELKLGNEQRYVALTVVKLPTSSNGIAYILTVHDHTESRELENMRLDFVSMAAHELRTPLTAITGYLGLIEPGDMENSKNYIERAKANTESLATLINNMLSLSRIERNALKYDQTKLDWLEVIKTSIGNLHFAAEAKHIELASQLPNESLYVEGDKLALGEVLGNLVNNAIHYTNDGGKVTVTVEAMPDNIVKTTVTDTGIGIDEESIHKLFTKYYRVDGGLTTNSQGTGIGLFISKTIVEAHGGTVGVVSKEGSGSSFYFNLPRVSGDPARQVLSSNATIAMKEEI